MAVSAGTLEEYIKARNLLQTTGACMASYSNRPGSLAVSAFEQEGWHVEPYKHIGDKADVKFLLAWDTRSKIDRDSYMLAVAGTENTRDVKVDLRANKVYFAGSNLEEFAANAARKEIPSDFPKVHEGFNQVAQLLLSVESAQSNDSLSGTSRLLTSILREDKNDKVYLVGHSLGGAVVTVVAARLLEMGVRSEQIEVISLGAPSVGNEAFVQLFDEKVPLTRIVVAGDPVPQALRRVYGGYRHLGKEVVWPVPKALKGYIPHEMPVYMDIALRTYYQARRQAINEGLLPVSEPIPGKPRLYVAPIKNSMPPELQSEFSTMKEGLMDEYDSILPGFIMDPGVASDSIPLLKAAEAGCDLLVVAEIQAMKIKNEDNYYISLSQTVYRVQDGKVASVGTFGSNTKVLTPILALINGARSMSSDSARWVESK